MKALIAMSGGVDSSAAALLTKEMGYECVGCTMELSGPSSDAEDAKSIANALGMPFHVLDFKADFKEKVIDAFAKNYLNGRTPNPCIECNRCLKFEKLLEAAKGLGCEKLVTGHYARVEKQGEKYILKKALSPEKDQSYVLYTLTQEQLSHVIFPLGVMSKPEVRELAAARGFVNANRPDSQDICFVPDGDYARFLNDYFNQNNAVNDCKAGFESTAGGRDAAAYTGIFAPGDFIDEEGHVLGRHKGIIHYTVGQRKGLGIAWEHPLYVLRIDAASNTVVLGPKDALYKKEMLVERVNWISGDVPKEPVRCAVKNRYRQAASMATVTPLEGERALVKFDDPKEGAAPGQSAVFYDEDAVLGGGIIE